MSLRLLLALTGAYVVLLAVIALEVPLGLAMRDRVDSEVRAQASSQAAIVAATAGDLLQPPQRARLQDLATRSARATRGRVIIVDGGGVVMADSAGPAKIGTTYGNRPEIAAALRGNTVQDVRRSTTLGRDLLATAARAMHNGRPVGAVRVTQSVTAVNRAVHRSWAGLALLGLIVLIVAAAIGAVVARWVARPVSRLQHVAERVAGGDLSVVADIDGTREQRSLAHSFNEMTTRLARLLRSHQDFVADASHQLRTPLTALRLRLEEADAALDDHDDDTARAELRSAGAEAARLTRIVEELLTLTRAPGSRPEPQTIDLPAAVRAAVARWTPAAAGRGQTIVDVTRAPSAVLADRADLDRVLDALVENALAYSPAGTCVTVMADGRAVHVDDEGPGIAPGEAEAVFERFHRGVAGRARPGGSGLGLAIARELAGRWDATVSLARRQPAGTRATVTLVAGPLAEAPTPALEVRT